MSRHRFQEFIRFIIFSYENISDNDVSSPESRWSLVYGFTDIISNHHRLSFSLSEFICIDNSYQGGTVMEGLVLEKAYQIRFS